MKVIWLTNVATPEVSMLMNDKPSPFGGWLDKLSQDLANKEGVELSLLFPVSGSFKINEYYGNKIKYYSFPYIKDNENREIKKNCLFLKLLDDIKPDLVHIHGTEYPHTLAMINVCNLNKIFTVISAQGLVSVYAKHMYANLPFECIYGFSLRDFIKKGNIYYLKKLFEKKGKYEIEAIQKTKHIIGRTTWDKACVTQINPIINYHLCNESLRGEFYKHQWNIDKCEKFSIFLSQASYPIKGIHFMIEAMSIILRKYPLAKLYVGGMNITKIDKIKDKLKKTHYGNYICNQIKKRKLDNNIYFTGLLSERQMCERLISSNLFVCPSSIENSPNSLGEAMLLGVPCIASYVGGIPDMMKHNEEGFLYQTDAPYMLAYYVCEIFNNPNLALSFSKKARQHALISHNRETNVNELIKIYRLILEK